MSAAFETTLTRLIDEEIETELLIIGLGQLTPEDYRFRCGKLAGMRQVLDYFPEVNKLLNER